MRALKFALRMPKSSLPVSFSKSGTGAGTQMGESKTNGQLPPRSRLNKLAQRLSRRPRPILQTLPGMQSKSDEKCLSTCQRRRWWRWFYSTITNRQSDRHWASMEPIMPRKCPRLVNQSPDSDSNRQHLAMNSFHPVLQNASATDTLCRDPTGFTLNGRLAYERNGPRSQEFLPRPRFWRNHDIRSPYTERCRHDR